jgi:Acetyltransferase (GNAT) domain
MVLSHPDPNITVAPLTFGDEAAWAEFVADASNGTLFHDLRFLAYHPTDRFRFHHLVFKAKGKILALLPAGLAESGGGLVLSSPVGASIGGLVLPRGIRLERILGLVEALQDYVRGQGWNAVELTLPPSAYATGGDEGLSFALFARGFWLQQKWLSHLLPLAETQAPRYERVFLQRQVTPVRAARKQGVTARECGVEELSPFLAVFEDTYRRLEAKPAHSPAEIADLLQRLPDRVKIHLAQHEGRTIAGLLVLHLNTHVANTYYICTADGAMNLHGNLAAIADLMDTLGDRGYRWLDLGPSSSGDHFNAGVTTFKEGMGSVRQARERWRWDVTGP